jgi:isoleucyl-tRNA synthetase
MQQRTPTFDSVRSEINFPTDEAAIRAFWKDRSIFDKTLQANAGGDQGTFVFYEGPPTANGVPHNGHVLTRVIKDLFPRFKTMQGFDVPRKAGWDTHGLPVEVEVSKELRIPDKAGIEAYGIEPFTQKCIESVFRYTTEWERITEKIGFWVDLPAAYVTFHRSYVESVWWALSNLFDKGLLYQGHKVVWWWAQGGTALSSHEVGQGWKTVDDPSVIVRLPLRDEPSTSILVWTTTPWTLPSNVYAAVDPAVDYAVVRDDGERKMILASALVPALEKQLKKKLDVIETRKGADLIGLCYVPPFDIFYLTHKDLMAKPQGGGEVRAFWRVVAAEFVTLDTGTGVVHIAPAFGEDDFALHRKLLGTYSNASDIPLLCAILPDGKFVKDMGERYAGRWVKEADKDLTRELEQKGLLVHAEPYRHDYPFCWRSDADPLIQMARPAWYIRTTERIGGAIDNNRQVFWLPEHIKEGRFGDFLANNVDWALSRERYWGTPLNVWICSKCPDHKHAPDSVAAIRALNPKAFERFEQARAVDASLSEHLMVHKPWIDYVTLPCPHCGAEMRRVPEVIDCWFDSGCMPFAQWGFPHAQGSREAFDHAFPADFISEAIDQTRGWFYSLLMISTLVFDEATQKNMGLSRVREYPHPYKTCIVLGHTCDKDGKKESKSKGNYTPPEVILDSVRMEFAAVDDAQAKVASVPGTALIAAEDLDGLDVTDGAKVKLYLAEAPDKAVTLMLKASRKLPRRVVLLSEKDRAAIGAQLCPLGLAVMPVEVPRLPVGQRVMVEDPQTPAPGADAFRWFFYSTSPPWTNTRHSLTNVRAAQKDFQIKLRNVYSFFTIYANIDGFNPSEAAQELQGLDAAQLSRCLGYRAVGERALLDRWILSEIALATREVTAHLEGYRVYEASLRLIEVVDALSNWYVRRSRERFWASGFSQDKRDAYLTLYTCLVALTRLSAPFIPFFAEEMYQNLVRKPWPKSQPESVHLCSWPVADETAIDEALSVEMKAVRELVSLGLQVRTNNRLKVRQPLGRADVVLARQELAARLSHHAELISSELNVHEVRWLKPGEEGEEVVYKVKPNFRSLGPKIGKQVQAAKRALESVDAGRLRSALVTDGKVSLDIGAYALELAPEDVEVAVEAAEGFAAAGDKVGVVVLHTTLTEALVDEGLERECLSRIQAVRKEANLDYTTRIRVAVDGSERIKRVCLAAAARISKEVLASELTVGAVPFAPSVVRESELDGEKLILSVLPV